VKQAVLSPAVAQVTGGRVTGRAEVGAADGRTARSQRTRDSVVEALLDLLTEGNPRPTAREIADRAGVSLRSVYVHFDDLEDLFLAASGRQLERVLPLLEPVATEGTLDERVRAYVSRQARLLEATAPVRLASSLQEPFSPVIAEVFRAVRTAGLAELECIFAVELEGRSGRARRGLLLSLELISNGVAWDTLRRRARVPFDEAEAIVRENLTALLTGRP
jgi:AcrR family transcriptional regulator